MHARMPWLAAPTEGAKQAARPAACAACVAPRTLCTPQWQWHAVRFRAIIIIATHSAPSWPAVAHACLPAWMHLQIMQRAFAGLKEPEARAHLSSFGISATLAGQAMYTLSGGQKSRVALSKVRPDAV